MGGGRRGVGGGGEREREENFVVKFIIKVALFNALRRLIKLMPSNQINLASRFMERSGKEIYSAVKWVNELKWESRETPLPGYITARIRSYKRKENAATHCLTNVSEFANNLLRESNECKCISVCNWVSGRNWLWFVVCYEAHTRHLIANL